MFFKGFKIKSAQKYISNSLKESRIPSAEKITNLAILVDGSVYHDFPFLKEISTVFGVSEASIDMLYYTPDKDIAKQHPEKMYADKDLGFGAIVKNELVTGFINKTYDGLLCYFNDDKLLLNLVAVQSKARFKIGFLGNNQLINDLSIATELGNIKEFTFELNKYLSILKKI